MKFFDRIKGSSLKPAWIYKADGIVWRLVPSTGGFLVGEERDVEKKTVRFFCLDSEEGKPLWQRLTFEEQWWIGIEAVHGGVVFLHAFASPDLPEHRGITAVDLERGLTLWSSPDLAFHAVHGTSLYVTKWGPGGAVLLAVDPRTGSVARQLDPGEKVPPALEGSLPEGVVFPVPVDLLADNSHGGREIQASVSTESLVGPVEAVNEDNLTVFSYHERADTAANEPPRFNRLLRILDRRTGTPVFEETLEAGVGAVVPDSFFLYNDTLLYVKDRRTITAVRLVGQTREQP